ncbi:hypothetical protein B8B87_06480 [Streptococcus pyogenes]|nr:hypothetical protein B8B85_06835 [Streptococcus pyogenes]OYO25423.1 hypothetical protein B8B87_06480 [Streptococcus pyogenes]
MFYFSLRWLFFVAGLWAKMRCQILSYQVFNLRQKFQKGNFLHGKGRVLKFPNNIAPFKNEGGSFRIL